MYPEILKVINNAIAERNNLIDYYRKKQNDLEKQIEELENQIEKLVNKIGEMVNDDVHSR